MFEEGKFFKLYGQVLNIFLDSNIYDFEDCELIENTRYKSIFPNK